MRAATPRALSARMRARPAKSAGPDQRGAGLRCGKTRSAKASQRRMARAKALSSMKRPRISAAMDLSLCMGLEDLLGGEAAAGAANTPIASTLMAVELFGAEAGAFAGIACVVSYLFSGHAGIYSAQRIVGRKYLVEGMPGDADEEGELL